MINGNYSEFLDVLLYGGELWFTYKNHNYFLQGWYKDQQYHMELVDETDSEKSVKIWEYQSLESMEKCANEFLKVKIWEGKDFEEIQKEVTWVE